MATNLDRTAATRARLIGAARALFTARGYAGTGTEAILEDVQLGRGALYHHFKDKSELFEAVCLELAFEARMAVDRSIDDVADPVRALVTGSIAWIDFATSDAARQILLVDAPTVLGWVRWDALDRALSFDALRDGLAEAVEAGALRPDCGTELFAVMANGALNALALRVGAPSAPVPRPEWEAAVRAFWESCRVPAARPPRRRPAGR